MKVMSIFGTRPEAIKLAPVIRAFEADGRVEHISCVTGQHREMLDQVLGLFGIEPAFDLNVMRPRQQLSELSANVLQTVDKILAEVKPDWVIVQGDTTSAFAAGLAAFHRKINVAHVEAGLRTGDIMSPWPEEMNRRLLTPITSLHFPPTAKSQANLLAEGVAMDRVVVTGNTVIDALYSIVERLDHEPDLCNRAAQGMPFLNSARRLVLVTGHRRENFGEGLRQICLAIKALAERGDVDIVYPVHLNPSVREVVHEMLGNAPNVHLIPPLEYLSFVYLLKQAYLVVTDSGGIQEEAPALDKPVLVTRDTTERPEAVEAGSARLVGPSADRLLTEARRLLDDPAAYADMVKGGSPYGDGHAARRIVDRIIAG